jgi:predicted GNAT family N-acyltransferase
MTDFVLTSLEDLLESWSSENVERLLGTFKCERDRDVEDFLIQKAIFFHKKHRSRTYLFLSNDRKTVLAYVTLGIKCLQIPEENLLSKKVYREMDVYKGVSQSYLIGQLGKADGVEMKIGPELIEFAINVFSQSFRSIGCRTVRLDCKHDLIKFYEKNGFHLVSHEKANDELYHMVALF